MRFQQTFRKHSTNVQVAFRRVSGTKVIVIENHRVDVKEITEMINKRS